MFGRTVKYQVITTNHVGHLTFTHIADYDKIMQRWSIKEEKSAARQTEILTTADIFSCHFFVVEQMLYYNFTKYFVLTNTKLDY